MGLAGLARWKTKSTALGTSMCSMKSTLRNSKRGVAQVLDVLQRARVEVVEADDPVALGEQVLAEVRAEEPGAAGHHRALASVCSLAA